MLKIIFLILIYFQDLYQKLKQSSFKLLGKLISLYQPWLLRILFCTAGTSLLWLCKSQYVR